MNTFLKNAKLNTRHLPISIFDINQKTVLSTASEKIVEDYESFDYEINQYGFRYKEPSTDNILLASGCSITFGQGLKQERIYTEIISKNLGLECVNVALPGTGPDIQIANAYWALQKYKPKVFLFYMSDVERKFHATEYGYKTVSPNWDDDLFVNPIEKKIWTAVSEKYEWSRYLQIAWAMYPIVNYCKLNDIKFFWKCWAGKPDAELRQFDWLIDTHDLGNIKAIDKARDDMHSGINSHEDFANRILDVIKI